MKNTSENVSADGICLQVFGELGASVTHEIKNTLSIINENAGLLEDLCGIAEEGAGVPVEHVDAAAKKVMKQVERSNTVLKNLNRFAHSGDKIPAQADLHDILSLMVTLTGRFAAMRKISVTLNCSAGMEVRTNLLAFNSLVFATLRRMYSACPESSILEIVGESDGAGGVKIRFIPAKDAVSDCGCYPDLQEQILAAETGAVCRKQGAVIVIGLTAGPATS